MCTALFACGVHPQLLFFVAFNRDEFLDRPTEQAHWWPGTETLAGRDSVRGGTWLAVSRAGRVSFLTNFREVKHNSVANGPSRGELPVSFVNSASSPLEFLDGIDVQNQNGFNLVAADLGSGEIAYLTNRGSATEGCPSQLAPGLYGLSNGVLTSAWPKVELAKKMLEVRAGALLGRSSPVTPVPRCFQLTRTQATLADPGLRRESFPWDTVFDSVLGQTRKVEDPSRLPQTGLGDGVERALSSILIEPVSALGAAGLYGTRSQTVIAAWADGGIDFRERTLHGRTSVGGAAVVSHSFSVPMGDKWRT